MIDVIEQADAIYDFSELDFNGDNIVPVHFCSIRSLWKTVQTTLDGLLSKITLQDLLGNEHQVEVLVTNLIDELENSSGN